MRHLPLRALEAKDMPEDRTREHGCRSHDDEDGRNDPKLPQLVWGEVERDFGEE